jgi:hypothetical protein
MSAEIVATQAGGVVTCDGVGSVVNLTGGRKLVFDGTPLFLRCCDVDGVIVGVGQRGDEPSRKGGAVILASSLGKAQAVDAVAWGTCPVAIEYAGANAARVWWVEPGGKVLWSMIVNAHCDAVAGTLSPHPLPPAPDGQYRNDGILDLLFGVPTMLTGENRTHTIEPGRWEVGQHQEHGFAAYDHTAKQKYVIGAWPSQAGPRLAVVGDKAWVAITSNASVFRNSDQFTKLDDVVKPEPPKPEPPKPEPPQPQPVDYGPRISSLENSVSALTLQLVALTKRVSVLEPKPPQPPDPQPWPVTQDAIDVRSITIANGADMRMWPTTSILGPVRHEGTTLHTPHSKAGEWPQVMLTGTNDDVDRRLR